MKKIFSTLPILLFLFLTVTIFRQYVFLGKVPFAGNLLVSFYEPWKSYPMGNYGANGPANKPIGFDSLRIFYPLRSLTIDSLKHFQLPLWNPYDFAGNTQLATYQSAVFFPLTPLFFLLPQIQAWSLVVFLEPFLTTLFTYFFLRSLKLSKIASTIGALSFGFSAGVIVLSEESFMAVYSLMFLPLILLGLQKFFYEKRFRYFAIFCLSVVGSILSGWFQSTLYALLFSFVWSIFLVFETKNKKIFFLTFLGFVIAFLISAPHLVPNIESYIYSARGTTDAKFLFDIYLLRPWELITYFAPDFYGNPGTYSYFGIGFFYERVVYIGIVGLFFGLIELFKKNKTHEEWFFSLSWILTVSLGISLPTSWFFLYSLHLPLISTILPSRILLLSAFCLSIMASFGLEAFLKKPAKKSFMAALCIFLLVFASAFAFVLWQKHLYPLGQFSRISLKNLVLPAVFSFITAIGGICLLYKTRICKNTGLIILLSVTVLGIMYFANKYLFFSEKQFTFPQSPVLTKLQNISGNDRVWSFGEGHFTRNFATQYHLQYPEGYDSFYIRTFGELVEASKNGGKYSKNIPRADAALTAVTSLQDIFRNQNLQRLLNLLDTKYIFAKTASVDATFLADSSNSVFSQVWTDGKFVVYKNNNALPHAFLFSQFEVIPDPSKRLATLFRSDFDITKELILNTKPPLASSNIVIDGVASIRSYTNEKVIVDVASSQDSLLFLSDNMYPGWKVYIDGKETQIYTADHTFRSVVVSKGKHTVVFVYQPLSVKLGFVIGAVGLLLFGAVGFTITKKNKK